jgi:hypothetical protein
MSDENQSNIDLKNDQVQITDESSEKHENQVVVTTVDPENPPEVIASEENSIDKFIDDVSNLNDLVVADYSNDTKQADTKHDPSLSPFGKFGISFGNFLKKWKLGLGVGAIIIIAIIIIILLK